VAALGADAGGFQPGRAGADDDHLARHLRLGDDVRHGRLAARRRVLQAQRVAADIDAVDAVAGTDALADIVVAAFHQLLDQMRVGDMGAGHGDHVDMALGDGAGAGGQIRHALGVEDRRPRPRA